MIRTDIDPEEVHTDIETPGDEGLLPPVRLVPAYGTKWMKVILNPHCHACGQPLPKKR